jgi:hypothetical protein
VGDEDDMMVEISSGWTKDGIKGVELKLDGKVVLSLTADSAVDLAQEIIRVATSRGRN